MAGTAWMIRSIVVLSLFFLSVGIPAAATAASAAVNSSLQAAQVQFEAGAYPSAIAILRTVLDTKRNDAEANYWLGRCYYELHDYDNAIAHAKRAAELDARNSPYQQWLGRAYGEKADRKRSLPLALKAQHAFEKAVRLDPSNISARRDLQEFYSEAPWIVGGSDKARDMAEAVAALDPVEGHLARGEFFLKALGKPDLAENEYRLVLDAKPQRVEPYMEIADFYQDRKNGPSIENAIEDAARIAPSDPRLAYYRGVARVIAGNDPKGAEEYLRSYLAHSPERSDWPSHAAAYEWLGKLYEQEGKRAQAAEQYHAALGIDPGRKEVRVRLEHLEKPSSRQP